MSPDMLVKGWETKVSIQGKFRFFLATYEPSNPSATLSGELCAYAVVAARAAKVALENRILLWCEVDISMISKEDKRKRGCYRPRNLHKILYTVSPWRPGSGL